MRQYVELLKTHKSWLLPSLLLIFLAGALLLTFIASRRSQDLRSKAAADSASLTFTATTLSVAPSGTIDIPVELNTGGQAIVGADILVEFDKTQLTLQNITKPDHPIFKTYLPTNPADEFDVPRVISTANQNGIVDFSLASFDYIANNTTGTFTGVMTPVTVLTFLVNPGATGENTIRFKYETSASTSDSNVVIATLSEVDDILQPPTSTVTVSVAITASPAPSASPDASPSASPSIAPTCGTTCTLNAECPQDMLCYIGEGQASGVCRSALCTEEASCICPQPSPSPSPTPVATPDASPEASPSPSASPIGGGDSGVIARFKFMGVNTSTPDKTVSIKFVDTDGTLVQEAQNVVVAPDSNGVFTTVTAIENVPPGTYTLFVKGIAHLTRKFTFQNIGSGVTTLDLTAGPLRPGDCAYVPASNDTYDMVNLKDLTQLIRHYGNLIPVSGSLCDLDFDNDVDTTDWNLYTVRNRMIGEQ